MSASLERVLVLDGEQASSLAIVRSLKRQGLTVHAAEAREGFLAACSRDCDRSFVYPHPRREEDAFIAWLHQHLSEFPCDYVIPVTDDTLQPVAKHRSSLGALSRLALAPSKALEICTDKSQTFEVADSLGLDVPPSQVVSAYTEDFPVPFDFPIVVKPTRSVVKSKAGRIALNVRYAHNEEELATLVKDSIRHGPVILQACVSGIGTGVEVLCDHGEVVAAFQHERLHEWPLTGGGSSYRCSVPLDEGMLDGARRLMKAIGYHGVAMVEYKHDIARDRRWLMEINGRFWGSLPLCTHAGADFPAWLYHLDVHGRRPKDTGFRVGLRARKFSRDFFWAIEVLRRSDPNPLISWPPRLQGLLTWFGIFHPRHRFDVQSLRDWRPGLKDVKDTWRLFRSRMKARDEKRALRREMERQRGDRPALKERVGQARRVLFLCYGNINRSAAAEADIRRRCGETLPFEVASAGFHPSADRPADPRMASCALDQGFDLSTSRSRVLDRELVEWADLILAMDTSHLNRMKEHFPDALNKTLLFACMDPDPEQDIEIADPYGQPRGVYAACLDRILRANEGLLGLCRGSSHGNSPS